MLVGDFISSIREFQDDEKQILKEWVTSERFGAKLDGECNDTFKETLSNNPPPTFNLLQSTVVQRAARLQGEPYPQLADSLLKLARVVDK